MNRHITALLLVLAIGTARLAAAPISGAWHGVLKLNAINLTLVFHFDENRVTLDSPDQNARGIQGTVTTLNDSVADVQFAALAASYRGKLTEGKLVGTFTQRGFKLPLTLTPGEPQRLRPQTPQPPYPYETRNVVFGDSAQALLAGTLTLPAGYSFETGTATTTKGRREKAATAPMCVLLVSGSGLQNRDEELFEHRPFAVIADYLARHGIASLRYDDRGFGQSTGDPSQCTTADFANDAAVGLAYLRQLAQPAPKGRKKQAAPLFSRIGIIGHSEGGTIAFMLGARQQADFVVTMAAPGLRGDSLLVEQTNAMLEQSGQQPSMTLKRLHLTMAMQEQNPWYDFFAGYDPADDIAATRCPILALNGSLDKQVLAASNLSAIRQHAGGNGQLTAKEYPGLNHLFQHATTGAPTEYGLIEETISEEVLNDMVTWLNSLPRQ